MPLRIGFDLDGVLADMESALVRQAEGLGVAEISVSPFCTSCHRDRFMSHRASGGSDGRMIAYLGIPAA